MQRIDQEMLGCSGGIKSVRGGNTPQTPQKLGLCDHSPGILEVIPEISLFENSFS